MTVALVHGELADPSGWAAVAGVLEARGHTVLAVANPLRGLHSDAAYVRAVVRSLAGPVTLAGHGYAGAVIGEAARGVAGVRALVFVAAWILDEGESVAMVLDPATFPGISLPPIADGALQDRAGAPAWRAVPSWALVTEDDRVIPVAGQRWMAGRAGARTSSVAAGHDVPVARPDAVAAVVDEAATAVG